MTFFFFVYFLSRSLLVFSHLYASMSKLTIFRNATSKKQRVPLLPPVVPVLSGQRRPLW